MSAESPIEGRTSSAHRKFEDRAGQPGRLIERRVKIISKHALLDTLTTTKGHLNKRIQLAD